MTAQICNLAATRSQRSLATSLDRIYQTHTALAGLALTKAATSFWAEYVRGLASYHVAVISAAFSPSSKPQKIAGPW